MNTIQTQPHRSADDRTLIFRLGADLFGLSLSVVREVVQWTTAPMAVPGAPDWLRGIFNHHGNVIPVIQLSELLAIETQDHGEQAILIEVEGEVLALAVNQIESVEEIRVDGSSVAEQKQAWFHGAMLVLLDPKVLSETIRQKLNRLN
jgi:chemotaxis signal transduction protein